MTLPYNNAHQKAKVEGKLVLAKLIKELTNPINLIELISLYNLDNI